MNSIENQRIAANYMGAVAHALGGRPGRHREFIDKVELVLSGSEPDVWSLTPLVEIVQTTGRPVIWMHHVAEAPHVPYIGLVAQCGGTFHVIENCVLWMSGARARMQLVPDSFTTGAFRFDDQLRLRHIARPPAPSYEAAHDGMVRAYSRLRDIEREQFERGEVFELPTHVPLRRAA